METLHVSCSASRGYLAHSAAMLHSVLTHDKSQSVHVHYLHGPDVSPYVMAKLTNMIDRMGGEITFHQISPDHLTHFPAFGSFANPHFAQAHYQVTWYRIFLPQLLPGISRVIHLDVDAIAMDSLLPLWRTDMGGSYVAAVTNVIPPQHAPRLMRLGLGAPEKYFNAGVLVIDLEQWRQARITEALLECARERGPQLEWPDQDALNIVLAEHRFALHPRWNCMSSLFGFPWSSDVFGYQAVNEACAHPAIRHFEGPARGKPWHVLGNVPMYQEYFIHRRQTPWPRCQREGVSPLNLFKRGAHRLGLRRPGSPATRW